MVSRPVRQHDPWVQTWLLNAPRWALSLLMGGSFGVAMGVFSYVQRSSVVGAVIGGALGGLFFGLFMGPFLHRQFRTVRDIVGDSSPEVRRVAARGTLRGPIPQDPDVRAATARLVDHQLAEMRRRRTLSFVVFGMALALETWLALTRSPWWWLAAAFFAVMLVLLLSAPRRLQRRAELLRGDPAA